MSTFSHRSFAGGEIAPSLQARVDIDKYQSGAKELTNFIVSKSTGIISRPGFEVVGECTWSGYPETGGTSTIGEVDFPVRFFPYVVNDSESYLLEFGHRYMRVIKDGAYVTTASRPVTNIVKVNPGVGSYGHFTVSFSGQPIHNAPPLSPFYLSRGTLSLSVIEGSGEQQFMMYSFYNSSSHSGSILLRRRAGDDAHDTSLGLVDEAAGLSLGSISLYQVLQIKTGWGFGDIRKMRFSQNDRELVVCTGNDPIRSISLEENSAGKKWNIADLAPAPRYLGQETASAAYVLPPPVNPDRPGHFIWVEAPTTGDYRPPDSPAHNKGTVATSNEYIARYAVSTVNEDGIESVPIYSFYVVQPGLDRDRLRGRFGGITQQNGPSPLIRTSPSGSWVSGSVGDVTTVGGAYKIIISAASGDYLKQDREYTIYGINGVGERVSEVLSPEVLIAAGEAGDEGYLASENYYREVSEILVSASINSGSGYEVQVGTGDVDPDSLKLEWARSERVLDETGSINQSGRETYRIYKSTGGLFGYLGETADTFFLDVGLTPDYSRNPIKPFTPFPLATDGKKTSQLYQPRAVCHYQQRRMFGGSDAFKERIWMSAIGENFRFDRRTVQLDDDAFWFDIAGTSVNEVLHLASLGRVVVFTRTGEWIVSGDESGTVTPSRTNAFQMSQYGSGDLPPLVVGPVAVFYQPRGAVIRDLSGMGQSSSYSGNDLTIFAGHLFRNKQIVDWCYQQDPESVIWCVRNDGVLLGLTYIKEQAILGWHKHEVGGDGKVVACAVLPEGTGANRRDRLYIAVLRTVDGVKRLYVERMALNDGENRNDFTNCDAAVRVNGWDLASGTMSVAQIGSNGYNEGVTVTVTSSDDIFTSDSVGDRVYFGSDGSIDFYIDITTYISATSVRGTLSATISGPVTNTSDWSYGFSRITGLSHLDGMDVAIVGDGSVLASPNNDAYSTVTVTNGEVTLPTPSAHVVIGLPYIPTFESLDIDIAGRNSVTDKQKLTGYVILHLLDSIGGVVGPERSSDDAPLDGMSNIGYALDGGYNDVNELFTGLARVHIESGWNSHGRICVRQVDPLPLNILAIHPQLELTKRIDR